MIIDFDELKSIHSSEVFAIIELIETLGAPHWSLQQLTSELESNLCLGLRREKHELMAFIIYKQAVPGCFEISYLAVSREHQRRGLMTKLFNEFLRRINRAESKEKEIWLEVHEKNVAGIQFYEKFGFQVVGRRLKYYSDGGTAKLYSLKI